MKKTTIILLLLLDSTLRCLGSINYATTFYGPKDGLEQQSINRINFDKDGLMWVTTWNGISRFDGHKFVTFRSLPGDSNDLNTNRIDYATFDDNNLLWLLDDHSNLFCFNPVRKHFRHIKEQKIAVKKIYKQPDSSMWVYQEDKSLIRFETKNGKIYLRTVFNNKTDNNNIVSIKWLNGYTWILTEKNLYKYDSNSNRIILKKHLNESKFTVMIDWMNYIACGTDRQKLYLTDTKSNQRKDITLPNGSPKILRKYSDKSLIVSTKDNGIYIFRSIADKSPIGFNEQSGLINNDIDNIITDNKTVWIAYGNCDKVTKLLPFENKAKHYMLQSQYSKNSQRSLHLDPNGILWVLSKKDVLNYYSYDEDCFLPLLIDNEENKKLRIKSIFNDKQGNIWLCQWPKGLLKVSIKKKWYSLLQPSHNLYNDNYDEVRAICEDNKGDIWSGTEEGYLYIHNRNGVFKGYMQADGSISYKPYSFGFVCNIFQDRQNDIWISTRTNGLYRLSNSTNNRFIAKHYQKKNGELLSDELFCVNQDNENNIWIGYKENGLGIIRKGKDGSLHFEDGRNYLKNYPIKTFNSIKRILFDNNRRIWLATSNGILKCQKVNDKWKFIPIQRNSKKTNSISCNNVYDIYRDNHNTLYITTFGGGIEKYLGIADNGDAYFNNISNNSTISNVPFSIIEDRYNSLWIPAEDGLYKLNKNNVFRYDDRFFDDNLKFTECKAILTGSGKIAMATNKGTLLFAPDNKIIDTTTNNIYFTDFIINNKIKTYDNINDDKELKKSENSFSVSFETIDFRFPDRIEYAYRLKGFDDWNYVGNTRTAIYNNVPKGDYEFQVISTNSDGFWNMTPQCMNITIYPSFWESYWGYALYTLIFLGIMILSAYIFVTFYKLRTKIDMEKQIVGIKTKFFTDIIHELRTPFTLIIAPVEHLLNTNKLSPEVRQDMEIVQKNTNHTLKIINQVLDLQKINSDKMTLTISRIDLTAFCKSIISCFSSLAMQRESELILDEPASPIYIWADIDKLESILYNIIGNAFKYSPKGSDINVSLTERIDTVEISITDHGYGISREKQKNIFNRFESYVSSDIFKKQSSGIGLALVKELMELHKGSIMLTSEINEGTTFVLSFKKGYAQFENSADYNISDYKGKESEIEIINNNEIVDNDFTSRDEKEDDSRLTVLLVDDNYELCHFLKTVLSDDYRVITAYNGQEALTKTKLYIPDLILSDIVMPVMNGIDLVKNIHKNADICHIPIVLLTTKDSVENMNEGLSLDVDDYITKPFSANYLKAKISNILRRRKQLQDLYREEIIQESTENANKGKEKEPSFEHIPEPDKKMINTIQEYIREHIDDNSMNLDTLASVACLSRSAIYKKFKCYAGQSPTDLIRDIRLKRAAELITEKNYNFSEIAEMTGFKDIQYFSRCFKQTYGVTPSDYKNKSNK